MFKKGKIKINVKSCARQNPLKEKVANTRAVSLLTLGDRARGSFIKVNGLFPLTQLRNRHSQSAETFRSGFQLTWRGFVAEEPRRNVHDEWEARDEESLGRTNIFLFQEPVTQLMMTLI